MSETSVETDQPVEKLAKLELMPTDTKVNIQIPSNDPVMSKRQKKKLKKLAKWETKKKEKRLKEREKYKQKKAEAIANGLPTRAGPSRKELKRNKAVSSENSLKVIVDLDYDDLMIDKDVAKCVKQLLRIYTINRRSNQPAQLFFAGLKRNGRIHNCLEKNDGYQNWDVHWHFESYVNICEKSKIVFLTSDSDNVLSELKKDVYYVIGGIVDHNHQKGLCLDRAEKLELRTARLPLSQYVDIKTRTVLSTYHVFELLLRVSEGKPWMNAILEVLPMRKGAKAKDTIQMSIENGGEHQQDVMKPNDASNCDEENR